MQRNVFLLVTDHSSDPSRNWQGLTQPKTCESLGRQCEFHTQEFESHTVPHPWCMSNTYMAKEVFLIGI